MSGIVMGFPRCFNHSPTTRDRVGWAMFDSMRCFHCPLCELCSTWVEVRP